MGKKRTTRKQNGGFGIPSFILNAKGWNHGIMGRKRKRSPLQLAIQSAAKKRKRNQKGGVAIWHRAQKKDEKARCIMEFFSIKIF